MEDKDKLFLLDAYALIFRAYYALIKSPRVTSGGVNTSAIFGFVSTLEDVLRRERPTHMAVCFDPPGPTFRHEAYADYKGEREATPEDIKLSIPVIKDIVRAYGIKVLEVPGYEADDVIGTLSVQGARYGIPTYMMTPDKDFGQLVREGVWQYKPAYRGGEFEVRGVAEVCARYGIERTAQVVDLLALMGDKVDNIPGCPGVGEKTAVKLIGEYGSVEELIARAGELKGALRAKVEGNAEQIVFSKFLATIRTDVPVGVGIEDIRRGKEDVQGVLDLFRKLEFRVLESRFRGRVETGAPALAKHGAVQGSLFEDEVKDVASAVTQTHRAVPAVWVDDVAGASAMLGRSKRFALLSVTEGTGDMGCEVKGWIVGVEGGQSFYLPRSAAGSAVFVDGLLRDKERMGLHLDVKRDWVCVCNALDRREGLARVLPINFYDLSLAHYLLEPEQRHDLGVLAHSYLHEHVDSYEVIACKGTRQLRVEQLGREVFMAWCGAQADALMRLYPSLHDAVEAEGLSYLLEEVEFPLALVLARVEMNGVYVEQSSLNEAAVEMRRALERLENEIYAEAGREFSVGSPAQVGEVLFGELKLDAKAKRTKTGQYSTGEEVLEKLAGEHAIVRHILDWRARRKLLTTYLEKLPQWIDGRTGRVHTTYNQAVTATGRLSSSDPNLQNIPVREELGRGIRRAFSAPEGCEFLSADYSQIELRLVADLAGDEVLLEAFREGKDIHAITASKIFHEPVESVSGEQRRRAKTANFGILYGISAFGLANRLGIPRGEAKDLIDGYFRSFPSIKGYMDESVNRAREDGFVTTRMGRRRRLPDILSRNPVVRGYAERNAINAPVQGSAADIIKVAMVAIQRRMDDLGLKSRMTMQVHDELNFDVPVDEIEVMRDLVRECMEDAYSGKVRMEVSVGVGHNWLEAH